jgi:hypothetical protein
MTPDDYVVLLIQARLVLERHLFDGVDLRDDVAEICAQIEDAATAGRGQPSAHSTARHRARGLTPPMDEQPSS